MRLLDPTEVARRTRAALAYAGLEQTDVIERAGISSATLARIVSKTKPRGASIEELWQIADACQIPRRFMEDGFEPLRDESLERRLAEIEDVVQDWDTLVEALLSSRDVDRDTTLQNWLADRRRHSEGRGRVFRTQGEG